MRLFKPSALLLSVAVVAATLPGAAEARYGWGHGHGHSHGGFGPGLAIGLGAGFLFGGALAGPGYYGYPGYYPRYYTPRAYYPQPYYGYGNGYRAYAPVYYDHCILKYPSLPYQTGQVGPCE